MFQENNCHLKQNGIKITVEIIHSTAFQQEIPTNSDKTVPSFKKQSRAGIMKRNKENESRKRGR